MRKGKAKKKSIEKEMPSSRKWKADTIHPIAKEKHEIPSKKLRPIGPTFGTPPQEIAKSREISQEETEAPMGQVNVKEEDVFQMAANITLADLVDITEQVENQAYE